MALRFVQLLIIVVLALATSQRILASDPDILSDYIVPPNNKVDANFFTYTGFRDIFDDEPGTFNVTKAALAEFPALNGQSVSYAVLKYPANGGVNPPHTHPRAAELLFLVGGSLEVGFVDTKNVLYTQNLKVGDLFVFPKGLVHYQYNSDANVPAYAVSAFGSANAGTVSVPVSVFGTGIDNVILAKSFKTDVGTVKKLKAGLTTHKLWINAPTP